MKSKCFRGLGASKTALTLVSALVLLGLAPGRAGAAQPVTDQVFKLREVSVFDLDDQEFLRGQAAECSDQPFPEVKVYPSFRSAKPIYGSVFFGGDYGQRNTGVHYFYALDESQGTGKGYDRFYFDLNHDLNLSNDLVFKPQSRPPEQGRWRDSSLKQQVIFDLLPVPFEFGPGQTRPVHLMPRFTASVYSGDTKEYKQLTFVRTDVHQGDIKIGGQSFSVRLGNDYFISGRLDAPGTTLVLSPARNPSEKPSWWGGERLMALHRINDRYYVCSASPTGDELRVRPYAGDLGTFQAGPGERSLTPITMKGSLQSQQTAVAIGKVDQSGWPEAVSNWSVPVGEYLPSYLNVQFGRLKITLSHNYHSDGKPRDRADRPLVYGIKVSKETPFVLDFTEKPEVLFASPAKDLRLKRGESLEVKAVLVDPKLDIMIRGLDDTTRKQTEAREGRPAQPERSLSLDPTVLITRLNGEKVAEGVMPFG